MPLLVKGLLALLGPVLLGALLAGTTRKLGAGKFTQTIWVFACLALPIVGTIWFPIVGLWDAVTEGALLSIGFAGMALAGHVDLKKLGLSTVSSLVGLVLLEVGARMFLPPPPTFPIGDGPHFLLSSMILFSGPDSELFLHGEMPPRLEQVAMSQDPKGRSHSDRPPGPMVTKEVVCSIAYGPTYEGALDVSGERDRVWPLDSHIRPDAARRILHVGDSMVFGANEAREDTFSAALNQLEPDTQHVNAGISGMAPDDYFVVLNRWVEREPFDLAIMYLFSGNDIRAIGAPHPCSNWDSILAYDGQHAQLAYPDQAMPYGGVGLKWLAVNSPLPYLLRVLIAQESAAAAYLGALQPLNWLQYHENPEQKYERLEMILRSAKEGLAARNIPFIVVMLPSNDAFQDAPDGPARDLSRELTEIAHRLEIPRLDATEMLQASLDRGEHPFQSDRTHFNAEGHQLVAEWLHEVLPQAAPLQPAE